MAFQMGQPAASAFLQSLLRDLDVVVEMGDSHLLPINKQLKEVKKWLLGFECVLLDGERKRQHGNKDAERWMDDLKDSFYDIDDLLDEIRMEKKQLQSEITGEPSGDNKVRYDFYGAFNTSKNIKYELEQILDILGKRTQEADRLELKRDAVQHDAIWLDSQAQVRQKPGCYADEAVIHGREKDKKEIIEILLANDVGEGRRNYEVMCVAGMGGLGKTTLAQLVFQDDSVNRSFAVRSWVCVSDVFNVTKVIQNLIENASENAGKSDGLANMPSELPTLQARLKRMINGQKFLLVLDDVWTANVFEQLKGPLNFGAKGSKILVTTRLSKVAEELGNKKAYRLGPLKDAHCLKIFNDNAFGEEDDIDNDICLVKMGEEIVRKCKGVPLVVKVIGAMLKGKDEGEWKAVKDHGIWELAYEIEDLHPGLRLSYFYLPPFLKRCFEYFALFPTDFKFNQSKLVRMWMAEGLIEVKEGRQPEEIGNQYYNDLKGRSLIQENNMMHDMVHHLACIVSGNSFFCGSSGSSSSTSSSQSVRHAFTQEVLIVANKLRTMIHKGELGQELFSYKRSRVLELRTSLSDLPSSFGCDLKHLRYLKLKDKFGNSALPDSISTLTNLQVLDLSYCGDLKILPQDVGKLLNLRFLSLHYSGILDLPDSIGTLTNLQELDLSFCRDLKNLPQDVCKLLNLRFLRLIHSGILDLPSSIGTLTNLQKLDLSYCRDFKNLPQDVGKLLHLRFLRLGHSGITVLPDSICTLTNLQELDLSDCRDLKNLPQDVCKLLNLQFLRLHCSGILDLPDSICTLTNLQELDLSLCWDLKNLPQDVGKLLNLRFLGLRDSGILELPDSICRLTNLPELDLSLCGDLKNLPQDAGKLFNLQFLRLRHSGITVLPDSVSSLINLRVLDLYNCQCFKTLPKDVGNLQSLHELILKNSSISSLPESVVNAANLRVLKIPYSVTLPAHIGKLMKLEKLRNFCVGKEKGRGIDELKDMNMIKGSLQIRNMENIESAEEALKADLRSKKQIEKLNFVWKEFDAALTGRDGEMEVRVMEALEPNAAIKTLLFKNYVGHKFPSWMSTAALHNLTQLYLFNLPSMTELTGMEFISLLVLELDGCHAFGEVSMTTPQLQTLRVKDCKELIVLKLTHCLKKLEIWDCPHLRNLPYGLHDLTSLREISLSNCPSLVIHPDDPLPPSITTKSIYNCPKLEMMEKDQK